MSTTRNPITNPVPGDVTRTPDGTIRVVYARTPDEERPGLVQWRVIHRDGETGDGSMPAYGWERYNANAAVLCAMDGARPRDPDLLVAAEALMNIHSLGVLAFEDKAIADATDRLIHAIARARGGA